MLTLIDYAITVSNILHINIILVVLVQLLMVDNIKRQGLN